MALGGSYPNLRGLSPLSETPWGELEIPALPQGLATGVLSNGLTYYVLQNGEPKDRAEVHLVVGFGSLGEEEDQRGGAHIIEHLGFSATKNYENHDIVRFLESIGASFGACQNAYTSFDRTVYHLQVATDDWEILRKSLGVLREFAYWTRISQEDVDRERDVVMDELRSSRSAMGRLMESYTKALAKGSLYEVRLPIGLEEVIQNCPASRLQDFYRRFYHPGRMAVIAVGDFDVARVESLVKELFDLSPESLGRAAEVPARIESPVPMHTEPRYVLSEDPELAMSVVLIEHVRPRRPQIRTMADFEQFVVEKLFMKALNNRLFKVTMRKDSIVFSASMSLSVFCPSIEGWQVNISPADGKIKEAILVVLQEVERVKRFGLCPAEVRRAKLALLAEFEEAYIERDQTDNNEHASEFVSVFLEDARAPGVEFESRMAFAALAGAGIDAARVAAVSRDFDPWGNTVIKVAAPRQGGLFRRSRSLQESDLRALLEELRASLEDLVPWPEETDDASTRLERRFKRAREEAARADGDDAGDAAQPTADIEVRKVFLGDAFRNAPAAATTATPAGADGGEAHPAEAKADKDATPEGSGDTAANRGAASGLDEGQLLGEELQLANGMRVLLRRNDIYDDEILLRGESWGGLSDALETDGVLCEALNSVAVAGELGACGLRPEELTECLEGLRVSPPALSVGCYRSQVTADCSPADLETMLLMLHLFFACPAELEPDRLETLMQMLVERRLAEDRSPHSIYSKRCDVVNTRDHPFYRSPPLKMLKRLDFATACEVNNAKLRSPSDWTLVLVGRLPPTGDVVALLEKYVGSIRARPPPQSEAHAVVRAMAKSNTAETVTPLEVRFPEVSTPWEEVKVTMVEAQCRVLLSIPLVLDRATAAEPFREVDQALALAHLWHLLETRLCERLRFELGKTYKVSIGDSFEISPPRLSVAKTGTVSISFGCDPEDAQGLLKQVLAEIDRLREQGFEEREISSVIEQERRGMEKALRGNGFWESTLCSLYFSRSFAANGSDIGRAVNTWKSRYDASLRGLTPDTAKSTLLRTLPQGGVHTVMVMMPQPPRFSSCTIA